MVTSTVWSLNTWLTGAKRHQHLHFLAVDYALDGYSLSIAVVIISILLQSMTGLSVIHVEEVSLISWTALLSLVGTFSSINWWTLIVHRCVTFPVSGERDLWINSRENCTFSESNRSLTKFRTLRHRNVSIESLYSGQFTPVINSVDSAKLPCYTLPPTQHRSFSGNLPHSLIFLTLFHSPFWPFDYKVVGLVLISIIIEQNASPLPGPNRHSAVTSCQTLLKQYPTTGVYWIDPHNGSQVNTLKAYCDMNTVFTRV